MSPAPLNLHSAYKGKCVLVTGHTGFKGSWLVAWLQRLGARVTGFSLGSEDRRLFRSAGLHKGITDIAGDVRDASALAQCVREAQPDIVLHLAAQSLVRLSYEQPNKTFAANVLGTAHLLDACREVDAVKAIVVVTTDKVYENREWPWPYREVDALGGHDPYSASKACAELVTAAYRSSFFGAGAPGARVTQTSAARVASARAGNVIGGGDWARDRILPDIARAVEGGEKVAIRNPQAVRPWQHVLEPLSGYLQLGARLASGAEVPPSWNFGPHDERALPVEYVARRFVQAMGHSSEETLDLLPVDPKSPKETSVLRVDSTLARTVLGWRSLLSIDEAIDLSAEWYRDFLTDSASARTLLDRQIAQYTEQLNDTESE